MNERWQNIMTVMQQRLDQGETFHVSNNLAMGYTITRRWHEDYTDKRQDYMEKTLEEAWEHALRTLPPK